MFFSNQLIRAKKAIIAQSSLLQPVYALFFSVSDGNQRAKVTHVVAESFDEAWMQGVVKLRKLMLKHQLKGKWLRIDWVTEIEPLTWGVLDIRLKGTKRNYFRCGLSLDEELTYSFLEQEINANAMLYQGAKVPFARLNSKNFTIYAKSRYKNIGEIDFSENTTVYVLTTQGVFFDGNSEYLLAKSTVDFGRRQIQPLTMGNVLDLVDKGSGFLANQVQKIGKFNYGYFPCFDRPIANYNALRHASSTYAMIEAWELSQSETLFHAIDRALRYLVKQLIKKVKLANGQDVAFLVDKGDEIKLGGNAVCLLALVKYSEVTKTRDYDDLLESLALGIAEMQDLATGKFNHVLNYPDLSVKEVFRIIYYDGEAAFGLLRLYQLTKDERWLQMVVQAFDYFIAQQHWKAHDHWLSYCVNELTLYRPEQRYFRFGLQNVSGHLDFILQRETTFPTLLELVMAVEQMLRHIDSLPEMRHLLLQVDLEKFYRALHFRAHHLLNGHFWPELAMYFKNPQRIVDSFFIRHHSFRVRIDDVEHYLSGFVAYYYFLQQKHPQVTLNFDGFDKKVTVEKRWSTNSVVKATQGFWVVKTPDDWTMQGVCIARKTFKARQLIVVANGAEKWGVSVKQLYDLTDASAILCSDSTGLEKLGMPVLQVNNCAEAVLSLGEYARSRMNAMVYGVTGSAGKTTTCSMLAHVLQAFGEVGQTAFSANLPHGIAWNLASIPWSIHNVVMELAVGRMSINSRLVRPDIAMVMNIAPAHLEFHHTTNEIARKKSAIFSGMSEGSFAILYHEMEELPIFLNAAQKKNLQIVTFGEDKKADVRLIQYDLASGEVLAQIFNRKVSYIIAAPGLHMVLNSLATLAAIFVSGQDVEQVLPHFQTFKPVAGRGSFQLEQVGSMQIRLLDESYNANPISMRAMLALCRDTVIEQGRRVIILGDMLELGTNAEQYHLDLLEPLLSAKPDCVIFCGRLMKSLWQAWPSYKVNYWFENVEQLEREISSLLQDKDFVAVKSSNGINLKHLVQLLKTRGGT